MNKLNNISLGADPELFFINKGVLVSAIGKVGGSKEFPKKIDDDGAAVQEDNVAVEFNIKPSTTAQEFVKSLQKPLKYIENLAKEHGVALAIQPSGFFPHEELMHPLAQRFGCDPDFNAWTGNPNPRPETPPGKENLRTCGGHIHVSWDNPDPEQQIALIKAMDLFLGVPSVMMDADTMRRVLYGKAGAFRYKPYGVEYRTLSNFWIQSTNKMKWAFDHTQQAIKFVNDGGKIDRSTKALILKAINSSNQKAAEKLITNFAIPV